MSGGQGYDTDMMSLEPDVHTMDVNIVTRSQSLTIVQRFLIYHKTC